MSSRFRHPLVAVGVTLLVLFGTQVLAEFYVVRTYAGPIATKISMTVLYAYTAVYLLLALGLLFRRRESVRTLVGRTVSTVRSAFSADGAERGA